MRKKLTIKQLRAIHAKYPIIRRNKKQHGVFSPLVEDLNALNSARIRAEALGFKVSNMDLTKKYYRFRQEDPNKFMRFRTLDVGKKGDLKLIMGVTKGKGKKGGRTKLQSVLIER